MARLTRAIIDLPALRHNVQRVRESTKKQRIIAIIKADAYGHGAVRVANSIQTQVDAFGVACIEEALELRDNGIKQPIVLLEGFFEIDELPLVVQHDFELVIHHAHQVNQLLKTHLKNPIPIWLKVNTGMNRLGFEPQAVPKICAKLTARSEIAYPLRLMSHLSCADDVENSYTLQQFNKFSTLVSQFKTEASFANSAGILGWQQTHFDWVRPGIMLYGVSPFLQTIGKQNNLQPVMQLESVLTSIKICEKGAAIGYGATWQCPESMPVGIISIGYGDGYPRHAPSGTPVLLNGQRVPIIGRVSMDMIAVDLRSQPNAKIGDSAILWGDGLPAEEIANLSGTIAYELLCNVNKRVKRIEKNSE